MLGRTAVAGRHGYDRDAMAELHQQRERATGQDFRIIRMGMNGEDVHKFIIFECAI